jgi:hypothetical protein
MIQIGKPAAIGVTFGTPGLSVAARVFDSSGPISGWFAMPNYDGGSYAADYTFSTLGAFRIKKVVFTDGTFTVRDTDYPEADDAVQVVDVASLVWDAVTSAHNTAGTFGAASGSGSGGGASIKGRVGGMPIKGFVKGD